MDATVPTLIVGEDEDIISHLPDSVLQHILSFLPTKYSVGTCILSKRWQFLWTSISNIDFDDLLLCSCEKNDHYPLEWRRTCFLDFVERVLTLRDASNIKKFSLSCISNPNINASRVNTWISAAIRRGVQELELSIPSTNLALPYCLFTCESLTVLKLESDCNHLKVPTSIFFPNLKTFHLTQVTFFDDHSTQKLFSNCPILEELSLIECEWENIKGITIFIPSLKSLTINYSPHWKDGNNFLDCEVKVYAESLIFFYCYGDYTIDLLLCNLSSLVDAHICIIPETAEQQEVARRALNLLVGVHNLESLTISSDTFTPFFTFEDLLDQLPTYKNLTHLKVTKEVYDDTRRALMIFLRHLPNLESLDLDEGVDTDISFNEDEPVPQCFKSHLKRFSIANFNGNETNIHFLKVFLKNAVVLEMVKIFSSQDLLKNLKKQEEVNDLLQMLPRESASCVIVLL